MYKPSKSGAYSNGLSTGTPNDYRGSTSPRCLVCGKLNPSYEHIEKCIDAQARMSMVSSRRNRLTK